MRTEEHYIATLKDYEEWHDRARKIAERYLELLRTRETVDSIDLSEETIEIAASEYFRGCEYNEWYSIPTSWLWDDNWEVKAVVKIEADRLEALKKTEEDKLKREAEEKERRKKQFKALKEEFGD